MQTIKKKSIAVITLLMTCATLFSFSSLPGGDSFEIYVNKKLVIQQYVTQMTAVKNISLYQNKDNDKIDVVYSHCGQTGRDRKITIKDGQNRILKQLNFADAAGDNSKTMTFTAKNILDLKKDNGNMFNLYYSSHELPNGKLLASVTTKN